MSRIGKKPIPLPQGVKFEVKGNTVVVQGPKGQVQTHLPSGVELKQADGHIQVTRKDDNHAAVHGLARALVNNAVEGVTKGWNRDLEIVGIHKMDPRDYGIGAQILHDLGVRKMLLLTNHPVKRAAIEGFGLEITDRIPIEIEPNESNEKVLRARKDKLGHLLTKV